MKEKTYRRMTKKPLFRGVKLFKQEYLTKQRFYAFLAKIRLVREEIEHDRELILNNECVNRIRLLQEKITTDRGVFSVSFFGRAEKHTYEHFYTSRFRPFKRLYTVSREEQIYVTAEVRCQCDEFEVRIDPFNHIRVNKSRNSIVLLPPAPSAFTMGNNSVKRVSVDFNNARLGINVTHKADTNVEEAVKECVQKAYVQMRNYIEGNSEEINERLTDVKCDGEFCTKDGQRLLPNSVCHKCGLPVFKSSTDGYVAQCICCDEDLYSFEVNKVDPVTYKGIYENSKEVLHNLLSE